jgi:hypothetical protein
VRLAPAYSREVKKTPIYRVSPIIRGPIRIGCCYRPVPIPYVPIIPVLNGGGVSRISGGLPSSSFNSVLNGGGPGTIPPLHISGQNMGASINGGSPNSVYNSILNGGIPIPIING